MDLQRDQRGAPTKAKRVYSRTLDPRQSYLKTIYTQQKCDANPNHRNKEWSLTFEEWCEIVQQDCHICGDAPTLREGKIHMRIGTRVPINGIDRIDSDRGYILGNVRSCCSVCNYMKNRLTEDQFFKHLQKIWRHNFANLYIP